MSSLHGTALKVNHINDVAGLTISRNSFLDTDLSKKVNGMVNNKQELLFLGNDIFESRQKDTYVLGIHGILPCGSKTTLNITGVKPYIDIRLHDGETQTECRTRIAALIEQMDSDLLVPIDVEFLKGNDFMLYNHIVQTYARVFFESIKLRKLFVEACSRMETTTYSNDRSSYYRVVARDYEINLSGWNTIQNYNVSYTTGSKARYTFSIDINDIHGIAEDKDIIDIAKRHGISEETVKYENMIVSSFDIEMIPANLNEFPNAEKNPNDSIFMLSAIFHFAKKEEAMLSIILTLKETEPQKDMLILHCANEPLMLNTFAYIIGRMQPDFIIEFNGSGFDWRNVIAKVSHYRILPTFLKEMSLTKLEGWEMGINGLKWFHKETRIKIGGATPDAICRSFKMQGFIGIDVMVVFKQIEPTADSYSLNECLNRCNLGSKDDMDHKEMWRIYKKGTQEEMGLVAHYCFVDSYKLQQLLIKKNVLQERREVANLSYTSMNDNFMFAGGGRMRNLLMNRGQKLGYFFDTTYKPVVLDEDAKYPGGFVVEPSKGIVKPTMRYDEYLTHNEIALTEDESKQGYKWIEEHFDSIYHPTENTKLDEALSDQSTHLKAYVEHVKNEPNQYPVSGLDFASLYPSLMMTYNISPEKLVVDEEYAKLLQDQGYQLQYVAFPYMGELMKAWFVRHNNVESDYSICAKLLIELFDKRAGIKKSLKSCSKKLDEMEIEMKEYRKRQAEDTYPRLEEYKQTKFAYVGFDSKQKAVKVFMNTLYGEMGNRISCICAIEVPGSVCMMGRYNLKMVKTFVETEFGMRVYYGDTDSLYVACNRSNFRDHDFEYFTGKVDKIAYGTNIVNTTFREIETIKVAVNNKLHSDNGSLFLKMAYEEVLYPVSFTSKKKYYGVPHEEHVDFYPRKLFIRGLENIKRGSSGVLKHVMNDVLNVAMDIKNTKSMFDIIKEAIAQIFETKWSVDAFAKSKTYRPDKNNVAVKNMIDRYKAINYHSIPEPNVRFKVVVCKYYPWTYEVEGKIKSKMTIGDRTELLSRVKEENLEIDLEYYFDNELTGQLAKLIAFEDMFQVVQNDEDLIDTSGMRDFEIEAYHKKVSTKNEEMALQAAKKYVGQIAKIYSHAYVNKQTLHTSTWREVCKYIQANPQSQKRHISVAMQVVMKMFDKSTDDPMTDITNWVVQHIEKKYQRVATQQQVEIIQRNIQPAVKMIKDNDLYASLTDYSTVWKKKIVEFIKDEYDYDYICKSNLPYDTIWDLIDKDELNAILSYVDLLPPFTSEHAMAIIDIVVHAINNANV